MKPATLAAKNTILRESAVYIKPRLRAEWEYNRYQVPEVTVSPEQDGDDEWLVHYGDPNTITLPNRPRAGIAKARADQGVRPLKTYRDTAQAARFYPSSPDDYYRYWSSLQRSKLTPVNGEYLFDDPIQITVMYADTVAANKLVVGFETSYARPRSFTIEVTGNGTNWLTAAINPVIAADGTVQLWYSANEWDIAPDYEFPVVIKGVRLNVYSMNEPYAHVDVLQLGARLENDLSEFLVEYDTSMEVSDRSFIAPMGKASSNTASITLSNFDGRFNNHNHNSLYYGMCGKKVKFTIDIGIDATPQSGSKYEYIREFTGWSDSWSGEGMTNVSVELKDSSVFLQEITMPVVFYEDASIGAIVWTILDKLGFSNYQYTRAAQDYGQVIPFYWPEVDSTVWDELAILAEATQTAIYFDENDILQIRPRRAMYADKQVDWNFDAVQSGQKQPDIIELEVDYELEANQVDIQYSPAKYSDFQKGLPKMETAWEPEDETVVLRASPLIKDLGSADTDLWIRQSDAVFWPYESMVNIRGEMMSYRGKEYGYYDTDGKLKKKVIFTMDEKNDLDSKNEFFSFKNAFTGRLIVLERGMFGSGRVTHKISPAGYTSLITNYQNTNLFPWNGGGIKQMDGYVQMTNASNDTKTYHLRKHETAVGAEQNANQIWYGTRIRFGSGGSVPPDETKWDELTSVPHRIGGLWFAGNSLDSGYFLEISPSLMIDITETRTQRHELSLHAMPGNAPHIPILSNYNVFTNQLDKNDKPLKNDTKGWPAAIYYDKWYNVDVRWARLFDGTNRVAVTVFLDGVWAGDWFIPPAQQPVCEYRFGHHVRGNGAVDFEYLYAVLKLNDVDYPLDPDKSSFLDLVTGGYTSGFIQRDYRYNYKYFNPSGRTGHAFYRFPQHVTVSNNAFDEFGPVVHEVREYRVEFKEESRPVGHSNLYVSNPLVETVWYESDAFGARFMLANASRDNVIVKGEDVLTFGTEDPVDQVIFIYGRAVYQEEEVTVTKTDEANLRKNGPVKVEFQNRHIQTEEMSNELAQWIIDLWGSGVDEVRLVVFGNPFLQLGDLVTINHPIKDMDPTTHKYFIVSIQKTFSEGYGTDLVLRRARI